MEVLGGLVGEGGGGLGVREEVALGVFAAQGAEFGELVGGFDAFGGAGESERVGEVNDGGDDGAVFGVAAEPVDEGLVDFDRVDGEAFEVAEGGVAGAEVVDGEVDAWGAQCPEGAGDRWGVVHEGGLGDLEPEGAGLEAAVLEDVVDLVGEGGFAELAGGEVDADAEWGTVEAGGFASGRLGRRPTRGPRRRWGRSGRFLRLGR